MTKYFPHILAALVTLAIIALIATGTGKGKYFDPRITFRRQEKIPYAMYMAYQNLKYIFPKASITTDHKEPGYWDSISTNRQNQALIIVSPEFNPSEIEMQKLVSFVKEGNDVFISTMKASYYAEKLTKTDIYYPAGSDFIMYQGADSDSLTVSLDLPKQASKKFSYPGKNLDHSFYSFDTATTTVLGRDQKGNADFIHLRSGKGNFFLHLAPLALSNYFLLHKENIEYYEKVLSVISPSVNRVVWDEYFLRKKNDEKPKSNWFSVFMNYKSLRAALLTAIFALLVFVLLEMRRKQRYIPFFSKPKNDSLDFVKTIGRLYHDKGDHKNLSKKMANYFLEHVRSRYKLPTDNLDESFIKSLQFKTGIEGNEIGDLVVIIQKLDMTPSVSEQQLADFHKKLESFYKKA